MAADALTQLDDVLDGARQAGTSSPGPGPDLRDMAELIRFVDGRSDAALDADSAAFGVDSLLDAVFIGLCGRYQPKSHGPLALIQWSLATSDGRRDRYLRLGPVHCEM